MKSYSSARISAEFVLTLASVIALGTGILLCSSQALKEADSRLISEESIAAAKNKQVRSLREALAENERWIQKVNEDNALDRRLQELVSPGNSAEIRRMRDKAESDMKSKIIEMNRLQAELSDAERSLEFEKNRAR